MAVIPAAAINSCLNELARLVESQKERFHSQINQLQEIVITQCQLTGVHPLAQEMAAGALSVKIGKRPRDLLNPKAIKYMQSIFSVKDTLGKKETREISASCGITVTQVRDYFSSQRSKVRMLVRLSQNKATKCNESKTAANECSVIPLQSVPPGEDIPISMSDFNTVGDCMKIPGSSGNVTSSCTLSPPIPENVISVCTQLHGNQSNSTLVCPQVPGNLGNVPSVCTQVPVYPGNFTIVCAQVPGNFRNISTVSTLVPANSGNNTNLFTPIHGHPGIATDVGTLIPGSILNVTSVQNGQLGPTKNKLKNVEEGPSKSLQVETTSGVDSNDKKFLENIFNLMRREQAFSGQEKLLEWVLQIQNSALLSWFATKGGIIILAGWLNEAALEEQTTVLLIIFKVLCHLPLHKVQPVQMSDILKTVNKLRFYRSSDISNRAKVLLVKWSKMLLKSQAQKRSRISLKNGQKEMIRNKQRTNEVLGDELWQSKLDIPEEILALAETAEDNRETEPKKGLKLLTDSNYGSSRKHGRDVSATKIKERRKVLLVEHPDSKAGRNLPVARAVHSNNSRPMSADDIQKAKMRASLLQDKYGKSSSPTRENIPRKTEGQKAPPVALPENRKPQLRTNEVKKSLTPIPKYLLQKREASRDLKRSSTSQEQLLGKLKKNQIQWRTPPEVSLNSSWRVGTGENSKEVQVQTQRNKREIETIYLNVQDVPLNPKEPWDVEMDFDDSLTPEIPTDQPPDSESPLCLPTVNSAANANASAVVNGLPSASSVTVLAAIPPVAATGSVVLKPDTDAELLAVLLKHPDVVEALTRGDGRNLSEDQMVIVLDLLKKAGTGAAGVLNGLANIPVERPSEPKPEQLSLPSPTPPPNATRTIWRSEFLSEATTSASLPQPPPPFVGNKGAPFDPTLPLPPQVIPMVANNQTTAASAINQHAHTMAPPATVLSLPQLTVTANPPPQQHQPAPDLPPTKPPPMYLQQSRAPETIISPTSYPVNRPSRPFNPPPHSAPPAFPLKSPAWPPANNAAGFGRRDGGGQLDVPATNSNCYANHNNYNNSSHNMYPRKNEYAHRPPMGTWTPEGGPAVGPPKAQEYPYDGECWKPRRESGYRSHHDWSRQRKWESGQQSQYQRGGGGGGRRWMGLNRGR